MVAKNRLPDENENDGLEEGLHHLTSEHGIIKVLEKLEAVCEKIAQDAEADEDGENAFLYALAAGAVQKCREQVTPK